MPAYRLLQGAMAATGAVFVAALGLLFAARDNNPLSPLATLALLIASGLLTAVFWSLAIRAEESDKVQAKWIASVSEFEECLFAFGAHFRGRIDWERTACVSRYPPKLSKQPVRDWSRLVEPVLLDANEQTTLQVARDVYASGRWIWDSDFHKTRSKMTRIVGRWVAWDGPRFRRYICKTLRMHRNVLVQLAYLEIACADALPSKGDEISDWTRLGDKWPTLFDCSEAVAREQTKC